MTGTGIATLVLIIGNILFSYKGFTNQAFFDGYKFEVDPILNGRDYKRLVTSGFLHIDWTHLILNMLSLYFFSSSLGLVLAAWQFLIIYFASLTGGDLLSLFIHRNHGDYSSVGASGAVMGIIFATIALFPGMQISLFFIPMPAWLFGGIYVLGSIYGIRSRKDNVGHDAHLGGALIGMLVALIMVPSAFAANYVVILLLSVPTIAFIYLIYKKPQTLLVDNLFQQQHQQYTIDQRYNAARNQRQKEVDRILEKIHRRGINSLTKAEKELLDEYSKRG